MKADEILNARSAVPAVSMRKRPGENTTNGVLPTKRQRTEWVSHKELSRLKRVADGDHANTIEAQDATYDIWDVPTRTIEKDVDDFMEEEVTAKVPKSMKQQPISLVASGKHVPAVPKPQGGYSYNPMFTDYEARLVDEGDRVVSAERARLDAEEAELVKQNAAKRSAAEADAAEERANLSEWEEDSEWEGFQSGAEEAKSTSKRPERKTQAQRNRIKRRKEEERLAKHKAAMKAKRAQAERIKQLAEEVDAQEADRQLILGAHSSDSGSDVDDNKLRRKQLGKYKLPEKDLELVLPDELQDSLRLLKPEGNLLKDRYRSMLVRGKVESRRHLPFKRLAKRKLTEKWTFKDFEI